jgi:hypothetical protein
MSREKLSQPLSIEQLEAGLRALDDVKTNQDDFWEENLDAFRQTLLFAIRETSDALLAPRISAPWRIELERQLSELVRFMELTDRCLFSCEPGASAPRRSGERLQ